jgi:DNA polymerase-1
MKATTTDAYELMHRGSIALASVEHNGVKVDVDYLDKAIARIGVDIEEIKLTLRKDPTIKKWRRKYGSVMNLDSGDQLADMIYNEEGCPIIYWTEGGRKGKPKPKTDEKALLTTGLPFASHYVRMKKLSKAGATYLGGIKRETVNGYLHSNYNLHTATTFRSSSGADREGGKSERDFNFQNLPIRNAELGKLIRPCFIAEDGYVIVEMDFSGIEVRVACCYTKDPRLISDFTQSGKDPHRDTAAQLFLMPVEFLIEHKDWAKHCVRDWSKNRFVFPEFYGSVYFQCAPHIWEALVKRDYIVPGTDLPIIDYLKTKGIKELGRCDPKAQPVKGTFEYLVSKVEQNFWNDRFKVYKQWKYDWFKRYEKRGYFETLTGFHVEGIFKRNYVINNPIQGSAFHCDLFSVIQLDEWLKHKKMKSKIIGQIHDSILGMVKVSELDDYLNKAHQIMTQKLPQAWDWITVPLEVEADVAPEGGSWYDKKKYEQHNGTWRKAG